MSLDVTYMSKEGKIQWNFDKSNDICSLIKLSKTDIDVMKSSQNERESEKDYLRTKVNWINSTTIDMQDESKN